MLKLGDSMPWPDTLEAITGQRQMDASALREYFAPLEAWLKKENERTGETIGWQSGAFPGDGVIRYIKRFFASAFIM